MSSACPDWPICPGENDPPVFPPEVVVAVKALACERPITAGAPLARWQCPNLARTAIEQGIVASISGTTIWRWLAADAIKPWQHRSWIFPRDPDFAAKAARVLELYARRFDEGPLAADEFVISADEKTSIQARVRKHPSTPAAAGRPVWVEHEYARAGALAHLAAWDVHRAQVFGRCEPTTGIEPFERLVAQVMSTAPYTSARRVFWIVDNGSSHRGQPCVDRLQSTWPTLRLIYLPIHASWLNQVEIYFSVLQRKVLTPNDFHSLNELETRLLQFQDYYQQIATPGWDGPLAVTPGRRSAAIGALLTLAGAATLAAIMWGLKDEGLYCVAVLVSALIAARILASTDLDRAD